MTGYELYSANVGLAMMWICCKVWGQRCCYLGLYTSYCHQTWQVACFPISLPFWLLQSNLGQCPWLEIPCALDHTVLPVCNMAQSMYKQINKYIIILELLLLKWCIYCNVWSSNRLHIFSQNEKMQNCKWNCMNNMSTEWMITVYLKLYSITNLYKDEICTFQQKDGFMSEATTDSTAYSKQCKRICIQSVIHSTSNKLEMFCSHNITIVSLQG
jgi:hypothetical protein